MRATDWKRVQLEWTWEEVAWILNHGGRERLERLISYGRDVRELGEPPTPPLVAWAVDHVTWIDPLELAEQWPWYPSSNDVKKLFGGKL